MIAGFLGVPGAIPPISGDVGGDGPFPENLAIMFGDILVL
jgi:hypothetical protein